MLTATETGPATATTAEDTRVSNLARPTQNETIPSDIEILRRVHRIRSGWSVSERLQRRRTADERFGKLLEALSLDHHAA